MVQKEPKCSSKYKGENRSKIQDAPTLLSSLSLFARRRRLATLSEVLRFLFLFSFFFFFVFTKRLTRETRTNPGLIYIYIYIYERVGGVQRERLFVSSLVVVKMWQKKCHLCCVEVKKAFETCALFQEEEEEGPAFPKPFLFPFFVLSPKV